MKLFVLAVVLVASTFGLSFAPIGSK